MLPKVSLPEEVERAGAAFAAVMADHIVAKLKAHPAGDISKEAQASLTGHTHAAISLLKRQILDAIAARLGITLDKRQ